MAILNLLKSDYTGSLGKTTGARWKNKHIVKAKIFSKAPPTQNQINNVRAFESLVRLSSVLARDYWQYFNLSDKKMLKHNAVANWLKPCVKNHIFEPQNIAEIIPAGNYTDIVIFAADRANSICRYGITISDGYLPENGSRLIMVCCDNLGNTHFTNIIEPVDTTGFFYLPFENEKVYYFFTFLCDLTPENYIISNFNIKQGVGMIYSTNEQSTGDVWIDGKPIYQKTIQAVINVPAITSGPLDYTQTLDPILSTSYIDTMLDPNLTLNGNTSSAWQFIAPPNSFGVSISMTANGLTAVARSYNSSISITGRNVPLLITVRYTKK